MIDGVNNPIITKVKTRKIEDSKDLDDGESIKITFIGISKPIAEVNAFASSGSGWCYGAIVEVKCEETGEEETLASW